ncbi:MAG: EthD family reductase [Parafilimonas sp.]
MIKVSVLYPNGEGKKFDMDYYCNKHFQLVKELSGAAIRKVEIEQGIAGGTPDAEATYMAMGHIFFDSIDDFNASFVPHTNIFVNDIPNFTNAVPVVQISQVIM